MRLAVVIAAAAMVAGFTVQDAEQVLDGEWAGMSFPIGLAIDGAAKKATLTEAGKVVTGPFKVESVSGGAATVTISGSRFVLHVRDAGKSLMMSPVGQDKSRILNRVR